jgi:type II restriction/modification system DNA methylase subunit YeeA
LLALKDIEHRVSIEAEAMGLQREFSQVGPASVKGIEINPYAAELARVSVWIGEIQWMRRNGFGVSDRPILKPLDNIECRDANDWTKRRLTGQQAAVSGSLAVRGLEVCQSVGRGKAA